MADTENFGWTKPDVGGSSGAWGTLLNAAMDDVDADVYALVGKNTEQMLVSAITGAGASWSVTNAASGSLPGAGHFWVPLPSVRKGQRITAFTTRGAKSAAATATAKLVYFDNTGAETVVSAGHSLSSLDFSNETVTTSGLTHDVENNRAYFVKIEVAVSTGNLSLTHVQLTITAVP